MANGIINHTEGFQPSASYTNMRNRLRFTQEEKDKLVSFIGILIEIDQKLKQKKEVMKNEKQI